MLIALSEHEAVPVAHTMEDAFIAQTRYRRGLLGLSQSDLAERVTQLGLPVYQQTIAKIEAGLRPLRLTEAEVIANALETTFHEMIASPVASVARPPGEPVGIDEIRNLLAELEAKLRRIAEIGVSAMSEAKDAERDLHTAQVRHMEAMARYQAHLDQSATLSAQVSQLGELLASHEDGMMYRPRKRGWGYVGVRSNGESKRDD